MRQVPAAADLDPEPEEAPPDGVGHRKGERDTPTTPAPTVSR